MYSRITNSCGSLMCLVMPLYPSPPFPYQSKEVNFLDQRHMLCVVFITVRLEGGGWVLYRLEIHCWCHQPPVLPLPFPLCAQSWSSILSIQAKLLRVAMSASWSMRMVTRESPGIPQDRLWTIFVSICYHQLILFASWKLSKNYMKFVIVLAFSFY